MEGDRCQGTGSVGRSRSSGRASTTRTLGRSLLTDTFRYQFIRHQPQSERRELSQAFVLFYTLIDVAIVGFVVAASLSFALSLLLKLVASLGGALLATRVHSQQGIDSATGTEPTAE